MKGAVGHSGHSMSYGQGLPTATERRVRRLGKGCPVTTNPHPRLTLPTPSS